MDGVNDYVTVGDNLDLAQSDAITIAGWIQFKSLRPYDGIVHKFADGYSNYRLIVHDSGEFLSAQIGSGGTLVSVSTSLDKMSPNRWYHVAVVLDSAKQKATIYIDGILRSSKRFTVPRKDTNAALLIGRNSWSGQFFDGWIDDLRIYDRALDIYDLKSLVEFRERAARQ